MANTNAPEVNLETLSSALKNQLKIAKEDVLTSQQWDEDKWKELPIGRFYKNIDKLVGNAVCDVTNELLRPHNERLTKAAQLTLRKRVKSDKKCKDAVSEMLTASLNTESIKPTP